MLIALHIEKCTLKLVNAVIVGNLYLYIYLYFLFIFNLYI